MLSVLVIRRFPARAQGKHEFGIGLNTTTSNSATQSFGADHAMIKTAVVSAKFNANVPTGKNTRNLLAQNASARDATAYGDNGGTVFQTSMVVEVLL